MYMFYRLANQTRDIYVNDIVSKQKQSAYPYIEESKKTDQKIGVVVTISWNVGCSRSSMFRMLSKTLTNLYVVVYINESEDEITLGLKDEIS